MASDTDTQFGTRLAEIGEFLAIYASLNHDNKATLQTLIEYKVNGLTTFARNNMTAGTPKLLAALTGLQEKVISAGCDKNFIDAAIKDEVEHVVVAVGLKVVPAQRKYALWSLKNPGAQTEEIKAHWIVYDKKTNSYVLRNENAGAIVRYTFDRLQEVSYGRNAPNKFSFRYHTDAYPDPLYEFGLTSMKEVEDFIAELGTHIPASKIYKRYY